MTPKQIRILLLGAIISCALLTIGIITRNSIAFNGCLITWAVQLCLLLSDMQQSRPRAELSGQLPAKSKSA